MSHPEPPSITFLVLSVDHHALPWLSAPEDDTRTRDTVVIDTYMAPAYNFLYRPTEPNNLLRITTENTERFFQTFTVHVKSMRTGIQKGAQVELSVGVSGGYSACSADAPWARRHSFTALNALSCPGTVGHAATVPGCFSHVNEIWPW